MLLLDALKQCGLVESFKAICTPEAKSSTILRRLRKDSRLSKLPIEYPKSLAYLRKQLGCSASHGGVRDMSTARPNIVVANGRVTVHAQSK